MRFRSGNPVRVQKLIFTTTSILFFWYANHMVENMLYGIILFELFHDVQYLAIVWLFNQRRAATDPEVGRFTKFLFRRSWAMLGLYLALVFAYGGFGPLLEVNLDPRDSGTTKNILLAAKGLVIAVKWLLLLIPAGVFWFRRV